MRILYLSLILMGFWSVQQAQTLVPITRNIVLEQRRATAQSFFPPQTDRIVLRNDTDNCPIQDNRFSYVEVDNPQRIAIAIDTSQLGGTPGTYNCTNCEDLQFGTVEVLFDTLVYTPISSVTAGRDDVVIEYCNENGCLATTLSIIAKRKGKNWFPPLLELSPEAVIEERLDITNLPGPPACSFFLDCPDEYPGKTQRAQFVNGGETPTSFRYRASRFGGIDSICVVLCDTFAICDTFNYAFRILQDTIGIPFMDDFSGGGPFPSSRFWLDIDPYVNTEMGTEPPTIGVATFDGLSSDGFPYGGDYGVSDQLTSKPIDLTPYPNDNLVLSYWVQKSGLVEKPEPQDSFVLEFKQQNGKWVNVIALPGVPLNQPNTVEEPFVFYRVPVAPQYRYDGFQFRFKNYSNRTGILDTWHLDYVVLDTRITDSIFNDIAFTRLPEPILKELTSLPWRHFQETGTPLLRDDIEVGVYNFSDQAGLNANPSNVRLEELNSNIDLFGDQGVTLFNGLEANIPTGENIQRSYALIGDPSGFPSVGTDYFQIMGGDAFNNFDRLAFRMTYTLANESQEERPGYETVTQNDQVTQTTIFDNYFSYDDGTAEAGIVAQPGNALAVKFTAGVDDTLRAVQFHFPHTSVDISDQSFNLRVWIGHLPSDSLSNEPAYEAIGVTPYYTDLFFDTLQGFTTYPLIGLNGDNKPIALPAGDFYISWEQEAACSRLQCVSVGFDKNRPAGKNYIYQRIGSTWSPLPPNFTAGSLMIRPIVGSVTPPPTVVGTDEQEEFDRRIKLFPNPTRDYLNVALEDIPYDQLDFELFNAIGQRLQSGTLQPRISLHHLTPGLYFLRIADRRGKWWITKRVLVSFPY